MSARSRESRLVHRRDLHLGCAVGGDVPLEVGVDRWRADAAAGMLVT